MTNDQLVEVLAQVKALGDEVTAARRREAASAAGDLAQDAADGVVVARRDGLGPDDLRQLVVATRDVVGPTAVVVLLGVNDGKAAIAAALDK